MSMIANFTPDSIRWEHVGYSGILEAGQTYDMPEARANHILNKYSPRGIIRLDYGNDEKTRKAESMDTWRDFWERQIENFNQTNEKMFNQNLPYIRPQKDVVAHAKILGQSLKEPWKAMPTTDPEVASLKSEIDELKKMIAGLAVPAAPVVAEAPKEKDWKDIVKRANGMNTETFSKMISEADFIDGCPEEYKEVLRERYGKLKFTEPCPF